MKQQTEKKLHRALSWQQSGNFHEAEVLFRQVLKAKPHDFTALFSLGVIVSRRGQHPEALQCFDKAVRINPHLAQAWYNRGKVLQAMKRNQEALQCYDRALVLTAGCSDTLLSRAALLQEMRLLPEALQAYLKLLELDTNNLNGLKNLGILLTDLKRYDEAISCLEKLLEIAPGIDNVLGSYCYVQQLACKWDRLESCATKMAEGLATGKRVCEPRALLTMSDSPSEHRAAAEIFARYMYPVQVPLWQGERYAHQRIRIAYVSPDLQEHPVSHLLAGVLEHHDKSKFETIAISLGSDDGSRLRKRLVACFDRFIEARHMSSLEIAQTIRSLEVDIAIDLAGYTRGARLEVFAQRPAPVQVSFLGYPATMGTSHLDYILADRMVIPEADQKYYCEKVVYLPDSYLPTDATLKLADVAPTREQYGLPAHSFVFCSFNHDYKITQQVFDVWMLLLREIPGSVLWLMKLNPFAERNLQREAQSRQVDPERLIFATRLPEIADHLARYRLADLFLDTTPYNAHTTASDALFAGLPVLTCLGKTFQGRVAASLLHALGLPELVAASLPEYRDLALRLARDRGLLAEVTQKLIRNRQTHPLFDTKRYCRNLESALTTIRDRAEKGELPVSFACEAALDPRAVNVAAGEKVVCTVMDLASRQKKALELHGRGELLLAQAEFSEILALHPFDVVSLYSLGVLALSLGDATESLHFFDRAAELNPVFAMTWLSRGVVLQTLQRPVEALASYDRALHLEPSLAQAQRHRDALSASMSNT